MKIKKNMTIGEILEKAGDKVDEVAEILMSSGMGCIGCPMAQIETLEQGCLAHGLSEKDIKEVVNKINEVLE
ncbi:MAG: DUF1858 domain-containing protein [Nanoarchaeota archaeon]